MKLDVRQRLKALARDEDGQTMLEYIVIIVFSIIVTIVFFKMVRTIVHRTRGRLSISFESG